MVLKMGKNQVGNREISTLREILSWYHDKRAVSLYKKSRHLRDVIYFSDHRCSLENILYLRSDLARVKSQYHGDLAEAYRRTYHYH